ncbi:hypothetical protein PDN02_25695 [Bacillus cereus]|nr:hypothetical protein [Bacillus cereus]MDA2079679.1 hypothetical protein [Bacillus cereus]MDA2085194.1 hypothetical protein [Bacillus cereus]
MSKNDLLRLAGVIFFIFSVQGILRPLINMFLGHSLVFDLFHLSSLISLLIYVILFVLGILLVIKTKPFSK